jgi:hypothetical protein
MAENHIGPDGPAIDFFFPAHGRHWLICFNGDGSVNK